jgi:DNA-binding winged helix-turn-helix (wHTH) protein
MVRERFAFGPFLLDTGREALFEHGLPVAIGGRALALLRALVEARGQVVAKSALMDAAWPDTSVEESNLTVQIAALRGRLRASPDAEDWIATFPRVGYRLPARSASRSTRLRPATHGRRRSGRSHRSPSCPSRA